jgi:hypothetical protein
LRRRHGDVVATHRKQRRWRSEGNFAQRQLFGSFGLGLGRRHGPWRGAGQQAVDPLEGSGVVRRHRQHRVDLDGILHRGREGQAGLAAANAHRHHQRQRALLGCSTLQCNLGGFLLFQRLPQSGQLMRFEAALIRLDPDIGLVGRAIVAPRFDQPPGGVVLFQAGAKRIGVGNAVGVGARQEHQAIITIGQHGGKPLKVQHTISQAAGSGIVRNHSGLGAVDHLVTQSNALETCCRGGLDAAQVPARYAAHWREPAIDHGGCYIGTAERPIDGHSQAAQRGLSHFRVGKAGVLVQLGHQGGCALLQPFAVTSNCVKKRQKHAIVTAGDRRICCCGGRHRPYGFEGWHFGGDDRWIERRTRSVIRAGSEPGCRNDGES